MADRLQFGMFLDFYCLALILDVLYGILQFLLFLVGQSYAIKVKRQLSWVFGELALLAHLAPKFAL